MRATKRLQTHFWDVLFNVSNGLFLLLVMLSMLLPFLMIVSTSFSSEVDIIKNGYAVFPRVFSLDAYRYVFAKGSRMYSAYGVTLFVTTVGTVLSLFITSMLAYGLSKKRMPGHGFFTFLIFFTMLFNGGMIPWYLVCKAVGLQNNIWSMIVPSLINTFYMFIIRNYFQSLPQELEEAANIDGASQFYFFIRIVLPLSTPALATIGLFYAIEYWNSWYTALMFIRDINLYPLQMLIREILSRLSAMTSSITAGMNSIGGQLPAESLKMAMVVVAAGPILLFYPFAQRYFVSGIMVGAVKG